MQYVSRSVVAGAKRQESEPQAPQHLSVRILAVVIVSGLLALGPLTSYSQSAGDVPIAAMATSSQNPGWPDAYAHDGNLGSVWSSNAAQYNHGEWIAFWFGGVHPINYVKMRPRFGVWALGFPVTFGIYYSDGTSWQLSLSRPYFQTPTQDDWVIIPLPSTVTTEGISIHATSLGMDDVGNYVFQLAEVAAGYDPGFEHFRFLGNNGAYLQNEVRNMGAGSFNPNKLNNWNFDNRRPFIAARPCDVSTEWRRTRWGWLPPLIGRDECENIYAPSIVQNGLTWNVYFGGYNGTHDKHDRIYLAASTDNFQTMSPHYIQVDIGSGYGAVNNPSVVKVGDEEWRMFYTALLPGGVTNNKTRQTLSGDGGHWWPNYGSEEYMPYMFGNPDWDYADVNGSNIVLVENGTYHFWFVDLNWKNYTTPAIPGIPYATSTDGYSFTYHGNAVPSLTDPANAMYMTDAKAFTYNSTRYFLSVFGKWDNHIWTSLSIDPGNFPLPTITLTGIDSLDEMISTTGIVSDGTRLYGFLYGASHAGANPWGTGEAIHAVWLQKKVKFQNDYAAWGDINFARGADNAILPMGDNTVQTGRFTIYDTDGTTLLYTSPLVTMQSGDIWDYQP